MKRFYLTLLVAFAITVSAEAEVWETQIEQSVGEDGAYAQFKLWIPPGSHPDRLIALTWGGNQCSLDLVNDAEWRNFAKSTGAGLLTCFYAPQSSSNHWDHATEGSGQALLDALQTLAQMSGEAQLAKARLYMVGDSQGGQFSFSFAGWKPDRVLGFVSVKGGRHVSSAVESAARVPGLFFAGELDAPYRIRNIEQTFLLGRDQGAPWCLAIDKQGNHQPDPCAPLLRAFLRDLSSAPKTAAPASTEKVEHRDINPSSLSWFPSSRFKSDWAAFELGKLVSSVPNLSFETKIPASDGTTAPTSCNLGSINSGEKSKTVNLKVLPGVSSRWDGITILDRPYLADAAATNVAATPTSVSFKLYTEGLPLGRFSGVIPLRFVKKGKPILGGLNVSVTATVVGDVAAYPAFIYLQPVPSRNTSSVKIEILSKSNEMVRLLSYEIPRGVSLISESKSGNPLALTLLFSRDENDSTATENGMIWLHLETNKRWIIRLPYFEASEPPS
jgi:pimeloyl-ACP methyl ester carboxylesterase